MKRYAIISIAAGLSLLAIGCSSNSSGDTGTTTTGSTTTGSSTTGATSDNSGATNTAVAYADVKAITDAKCAGCHGENGKGGIDVRSYDSLMKGGQDGPIVKAGEPDSSDLVKVLKTDDPKKRMPLNQPPLPADEIAKIEAWAKAGAKNS